MKDKIKLLWGAISAGKEARYLFILLCISFILNIDSIWWGLPINQNLSWAPDEILPHNLYRGMRQAFSLGWHERYPPLHYYLLSILYLPFTILHYFGYADLRSYEIIRVLILYGRFLSVIMGTASIYIVYRCGEELDSKRSGLFAALIGATICSLNYYSKIINLDVPYLFWFLLSLLFFLKLLRNNKRVYYILFSVCAVFSICTKDQAYGLFLGVPLIIVINTMLVIKQAAITDQIVYRKSVIHNSLISLLIGIGLFFILHNVMFNLSGFISHVQLITGSASKAYRIYQNSLAGHMAMLLQSFKHIHFMLGTFFFVTCLSGVALSLCAYHKNHRLVIMLIFPLSYYLTFISVIGYNYARFFLPVSIILSLYGGIALKKIFSVKRVDVKILMACLLSLSCIHLFYNNFTINQLMRNDSRYKAESWIKNNIPYNNSIYAIGYKEYSPRVEHKEFHNGKKLSDVFKDEPKPDYIITVNYSGSHASFLKNKPDEKKIFQKLVNNELGYSRVYSYQYSMQPCLVTINDIFTNLDKINPLVEIYKKNKEKEGDLN